MKTNRISSLLLVLNVIVLLFIAASRNDQQTFSKISVQEFDLVDKNGQQRVNIKVEENDEVVFRMRDAKGTIRIKLGAGEDGSGLVLLDDSTEPAIHALAKKNGGSLTLQDKSGKKRTY